MQRLVRVHCRGGPSSRLRAHIFPSHSSVSCTVVRPIAARRFLVQRTFTCQIPPRPRQSRNYGRIPRTPFLLGLAAAATIPLVSQPANDEVEAEEDEPTLEQSLLDTSEEERKGQTYSINQDRSIFYRVWRRIKVTFVRYLYEPIATGLRFVQLVVIFVPVLVTIPVIFIGPRIPESDNERSGTLWWYQFLVRQMEHAGATFIKVSIIPLHFVLCAFPRGFTACFQLETYG